MPASRIKLDKALERIIKDSESGSTELLIKLARLYKSHLNDITCLNKLIKDSNYGLSSFAGITNYNKSVSNALKKKDTNLLRNIILTPLKLNNTPHLIYEGASDYLKGVKKVFTLSNSSTIFEILCIHKNYTPGLKIHLVESRPRNESRILAKKLLRKNIKVEFGTDAQMSLFISKSDAVFCGADVVFKDGRVVNKTGSILAAIAARYYKKPFYVFAGSTKISSGFKGKNGETSEVWRYSDKDLKIINNYFEVIPSELITAIFTEKKS